MMSKMSSLLSKIGHSYQIIVKVLSFIITAVIVIWLMPRTAKFKYDYQKMRPWQYESLYAPFDFPIYKTDEQLKLETETALKDIYPIFVFDTKATKDNKERMLNDFETQWSGRDKYKDDNRELLKSLYDTIENVGILSNISMFDNFKPESLIDVVKDRVVKTKPMRDFYTMKTATDLISQVLSNADDDIDKMLLNKLLRVHLHQNLIYSEDLTQRSNEQVLSTISLTFGMVQKDELIISEGEIIDEDKYNILNSLRKEYDYSAVDGFFSKYITLYGQIIIVGLAFVFLFFTIYLLRPDVLKEIRSVNMILVMMLLVIIPSLIIIKHYQGWIYVVPITILLMLLVTFFSAEIAIIIQALTLIIIGMAVPNSFSFFVIQFSVSLVSIFFLSRNTSRSRYFLTSLLIFISYTIMGVGVSLIFEGNIDSIRSDIGFFALNALFSMLVLPLTFLFERLFGFVTDMTLLELSNTNSPLLRKLSSEAPGTFQHVMQVADLCEEALYAIGGNMLLARTGAMYHDVGKIRHPLYFTENQSGKYNLHNDMSYQESAYMIIQHVIDGIEICRKYHVPELIIDFVRTHHGTRRTEYFYQMELRENPDAEINENDFRYHGPIPFSKETAVLMMADSVEAASRSLKEKTEENINKLVDAIIDNQVSDNQFINTDLTLRDITMIKKVFKKKLMNMYHVRIAYPV